MSVEKIENFSDKFVSWTRKGVDANIRIDSL